MNVDNGILIERCQNITVLNSTIMDNGNFGALIKTSGNLSKSNSLYQVVDSTTRDNFINSSVVGISLRNCTLNTLSDNMLHRGFIVVSGDLFELIGHTIDMTNMIDDKPTIYKYNETNIDPADFTSTGAEILVNCFCKTKYCIRHAIMLSKRQENCWACKNLLKID